MWLDRALAEPCWLEEYLTIAGVADLDWRRGVPPVVVEVIRAMHRTRSYAEIADHFAAAAAVHLAVQSRTARLDQAAVVLLPLGGRWVPSKQAVHDAHDAPERSARRAEARAVLAAQRATVAAETAVAQLPLFDIPRPRRSPEKAARGLPAPGVAA